MVGIQDSRVELSIVIQLLDSLGKVQQEFEEVGHSFVRNFLTMLYCAANSIVSGYTLLNNFNGAARVAITSYNASASRFACNALSGDSSFGVVVGTDDGSITAKAITNWKLGAQVGHGSVAGTLSHGGVSGVNPVNAGDNLSTYAGVTRSFGWNSGSLVIKEVGLICKTNWQSTSTLDTFLLARDILVSPVTVASGSLNVSYRIKTYV